MAPARQDERITFGDMDSGNRRGLMPDFPQSFRSLLEQVRMDKRREMDRLIETVQTEMALERILEG